MNLLCYVIDAILYEMQYTKQREREWVREHSIFKYAVTNIQKLAFWPMVAAYKDQMVLFAN